MFFLSFVCSPFSRLPHPSAPQPTLPWFHGESNIYSLKLTCSVFRSQLLSLPWGRAGTSGDVIWRTNTSSSIVSYAIYLFYFIFHSDGDTAGRAQAAAARRAAAQRGKTRNRLTATQQAAHRWQWRRHNEHAAAVATQRARGGDTTRRHNEHATTQRGDTMSTRRRRHDKATRQAHGGEHDKATRRACSSGGGSNMTRRHDKHAAANTT